jgi:hypothetical protein
MTLAHILLIGILSASPGQASSASAGNSAEGQSASQQQNSSPEPVQSPATTPASNSAQTGSGQAAPASQPPAKTANSKKRSKARKNSAANCNSTAPNPKPANGATSTNTSASGAKTSPSNCPPTKVIVQQGSTTEPSIELAGGASGAQASNERNTAIQMLETTEANLKKVEATQPDSNQQEMIKQVRQFMDQSKAATSAGDLDQARTLAWKAQLLSEELLKPQK